MPAADRPRLHAPCGSDDLVEEGRARARRPRRNRAGRPGRVRNPRRSRPGRADPAIAPHPRRRRRWPTPCCGGNPGPARRQAARRHWPKSRPRSPRRPASAMLGSTQRAGLRYRSRRSRTPRPAGAWQRRADPSRSAEQGGRGRRPAPIRHAARSPTGSNARIPRPALWAWCGYPRDRWCGPWTSHTSQ
jgi:hypothetical protein